MNFKLIALTFVLGASVGGFLSNRLHKPETIVTVVHDTKEVTVKVPVLTERVVSKLVTDPREKEAISRLMAENKSLRLEVFNLTMATARLDSRGGGPVEVVPPVVDKPQEDTTYRFKDWQLEATYTTKTFNYTLSQQFNVVTTTGRDKRGTKIGLVKVFQDTPAGLKEVPSRTTAIFSDESLPRWRVSPRIQAGFGINNDASGGIVAVQWLKRGRSTAAEDTRWAAGSPVVFLTNKAPTYGVLPVSLNLGTIPHQPFTNIWVSPFVDQGKRVGFTLSATF